MENTSSQKWPFIRRHPDYVLVSTQNPLSFVSSKGNLIFVAKDKSDDLNNAICPKYGGLSANTMLYPNKPTKKMLRSGLGTQVDPQDEAPAILLAHMNYKPSFKIIPILHAFTTVLIVFSPFLVDQSCTTQAIMSVRGEIALLPMICLAFSVIMGPLFSCIAPP